MILNVILISCYLFSCAIVFRCISKHLGFMNAPQYQYVMCRILLIVPIYGTAMCCMYYIPQWSEYCEAIVSCFEAYVIYAFTDLLIKFLGGEEQIVSDLDMKGRLHHPWPLNLLWQPMTLNRSFFYKMKKGVLQFVFINIICAGYTFWNSNEFHDEHHLKSHRRRLDTVYPPPWTSRGTVSVNGSGRPPIIVPVVPASSVKVTGASEPTSTMDVFFWFLGNISVTIALYCLMLFFLSVRDKLSSFNPVLKFGSIKVMMFLSFWQKTAAALMEKLHLLPTLLPCRVQLTAFTFIVELPFLAIALSLAFSFEDFIKPSYWAPGHVLEDDEDCDEISATNRLKDLNFHEVSGAVIKDNENLNQPMKVKSEVLNSMVSLTKNHFHGLVGSIGEEVLGSAKKTFWEGSKAREIKMKDIANTSNFILSVNDDERKRGVDQKKQMQHLDTSTKDKSSYFDEPFQSFNHCENFNFQPRNKKLTDGTSAFDSFGSAEYAKNKPHLFFPDEVESSQRLASIGKRLFNPESHTKYNFSTNLHSDTNHSSTLNSNFSFSSTTPSHSQLAANQPMMSL